MKRTLVFLIFPILMITLFMVPVIVMANIIPVENGAANAILSSDTAAIIITGKDVQTLSITPKITYRINTSNTYFYRINAGNIYFDAPSLDVISRSLVRTAVDKNIVLSGMFAPAAINLRSDILFGRTTVQATANYAKILDAGASGLDSGLNTAYNSVTPISTLQSGLMGYESMLATNSAGNNVNISVNAKTATHFYHAEATVTSGETQAFTIISDDTTLPTIVLSVATTGQGENLDFNDTDTIIEDTGAAIGAIPTTNHKVAAHTANDLVDAGLVAMNFA